MAASIGPPADDVDDLTTVLQGEIVTLEPLAPSHAEGLWSAARHPEIWAWTTPVGAWRSAQRPGAVTVAVAPSTAPFAASACALT
jgi:hypothetical protein